MLLTSTHYRPSTWIPPTKVFAPVIGSIVSPPSFDLCLSWGTGLVINHCHFCRTCLTLIIMNLMLVFSRMQWLDFTLTLSSFSLVVQLLSLPAFHEFSPILILHLGPPPPCIPYRHLHCDVFGQRVKVRLIFMLYFNLLKCFSGFRVVILSHYIPNWFFCFSPPTWFNYISEFFQTPRWCTSDNVTSSYTKSWIATYGCSYPCSPVFRFGCI